MTDYYALLEVSRDASLAQIKRSYRRLVRLYHPDVNKQAHQDRIRKLNEAYEVLAALQELLRRQREEALRQPRMTWSQGIVGFVKEFKKALREE